MTILCEEALSGLGAAFRQQDLHFEYHQRKADPGCLYCKMEKRP